MSATPNSKMVFLRGFVPAFLLVVTIATTLAFVMPETYESAARIYIGEPDAPISTPTTNFLSDPHFIQQEMGVLKSQTILEPVIQKLHLSEVWGEKYGGGPALTTAETSRLLQRHIKIRGIGTNGLVEIRAASEDPFAAADIANALAQAYRDYRDTQSRAATAKAGAELGSEFAKCQKEATAAAQEVEKLKKKLTPEDLNEPVSTDPQTPSEHAALRNLEGQRILLDLAYQRHLQLAEFIRTNGSHALPELIQARTEAPALATRLHEFAMAQSNLLAFQAHDVAATTAQTNTTLAERTFQLEICASNLLAVAQAQAQTEKATLDELENQIEKVRRAPAERAARTQPYYIAIRKWKLLQNRQKVLEQKIATEIESPGFNKTEIIELAQPSKLPIKPNKPLKLSVGMVGGAALGSITGLFNLLIAFRLQRPQSMAHA